MLVFSWVYPGTLCTRHHGNGFLVGCSLSIKYHLPYIVRDFLSLRYVVSKICNLYSVFVALRGTSDVSSLEVPTLFVSVHLKRLVEEMSIGICKWSKASARFQ
jgi:hypothetical protein